MTAPKLGYRLTYLGSNKVDHQDSISMDRLFFMHDYAVFAFGFLKQKESIALLQNHFCCKQS